MRKAISLYGQFLEILGIGAGGVLATLATLIALDVLIRNLGIGNFPWLIEVAEYGLYISTFLAAPWVLHLGGHVRVDVLITLLPKPAAKALDALVDLTGLAISVMLLYFAVLAAHDAHSIGSMIFKELVLPEWVLLSVMPFGFALLAVEFALRLLRVSVAAADERDEILSREGL